MRLAFADKEISEAYKDVSSVVDACALVGIRERLGNLKRSVASKASNRNLGLVT